jgi:predicted transcriptional regulator of viral defense system
MIRKPQTINRLLANREPVRARDLEAAGVHRMQLTRQVAAGTVVRVGRGLYALPGREHLTEHLGMVEVARRAPKVVFCLLTALRFHELTTQSPFQVWIAIGNKDHPPRLDYPPLRTVRFAPAALREGVEVHRVANVPLRVTSVARTVADCFKFRNKIGLDVALEALRDAWRARRFTMDELDRYTKLCRVQRVMRPYLEALTT